MTQHEFLKCLRPGGLTTGGGVLAERPRNLRATVCPRQLGFQRDGGGGSLGRSRRGGDQSISRPSAHATTGSTQRRSGVEKSACPRPASKIISLNVSPGEFRK